MSEAQQEINPKKNIVLCADGTGNSGGVGKDTNVWRLYEAVDKSASQIAFHDNGVGTNNNVLMKSLGMAFGYGLSKNIRQLYKNAVMQYDDNTDLFLFGFSRGAHTIRLLAAMICSFGLLKRKSFENERQLDKAIKQLHRKFKSAMRKAWLLKIISSLKGSSQDKLSKNTQRSIKQKINAHRIKLNSLLGLDTNENVNDHMHTEVEIKFIGVWDTVSAMGMPIDELRNNIFFAGHAFVDNKLHENVKCGRQALAIDEMRQTFKPELWYQSKNSNENILQVWFSGVHSNIGGGYPKDQLSLPSLYWMMGEAHSQGLVFHKEKVKEIKIHANPNGTMYNSRSGIANIYRFKPRNIETLTHQSMNDTNAIPKIHKSVYQRVMQSPADYSPFNLPRNAMIASDGKFDIPASKSEKYQQFCNTQIEKNKESQNNPWNIVWWLRVFHFVFLFTLLSFVYYGYTLTDLSINGNTEYDNKILGLIQTGLNTLAQMNVFYVGKLLLPGYANNLSVFALFIVVILALIVYRKFLETHLRNIGGLYWNISPYDKNRIATTRMKTDILHKVIFSMAQFFRAASNNTRQILTVFKNTLIPIVTTSLIALILFLVAKYLLVDHVSNELILNSLLIVLFPIVIFFCFLKIMFRLSKYHNVTTLLETELPGKKRLNQKTSGYNINYVHLIWSVIKQNDDATLAEKKMLKYDLLFPLFYGAGLFASLFACWTLLNKPFDIVWLILPVAVIIITDWIENSIQINQLNHYIKKGQEGLSQYKIAIASMATRIKLTLIPASYMLVIALLILIWKNV